MKKLNMITIALLTAGMIVTPHELSALVYSCNPQCPTTPEYVQERELAPNTVIYASVGDTLPNGLIVSSKLLEAIQEQLSTKVPVVGRYGQSDPTLGARSYDDAVSVIKTTPPNEVSHTILSSELIDGTLYLTYKLSPIWEGASVLDQPWKFGYRALVKYNSRNPLEPAFDIESLNLITFDIISLD